MKKITLFFKVSFIIALFLKISFYNSAFADNKNCNLNGRWFDFGGKPTYKLKQIGSRITMDEEMIHPICGAYLIDGTNDGHNFSFKFSMSNQEKEYCRFWGQISGVFTSSDCTKITGKAISHLEGLNPLTYSFSWYRNIVKIISPNPIPALIITAEPKMPVFNAAAVLENPDAIDYISHRSVMNYQAPPFTWKVRLKHSPISGKLEFDIDLDEVATNDPTFTPNFNLLKTTDKHELVTGGIMGGELTLSVDYYKAMRDEKKYIIKGTNPGQIAIEKILTHKTTRQIACQESRYKQFVANREGGVGFPVIGLNKFNKPVGGAGIMQLFRPKPTAAQVWNWRENLKKGLREFDDKLIESKHAHIKENIRLNTERKAMGMSLCPQNAITPLNEEQLNRETIRRYNCGREYRWEPRDAPNCKGKWVVDLSCKRNHIDGYDEDYVNKLLNCNINA